MANNYILLKIDGLLGLDYTYLDSHSDCYYFMEYTPEKGFDYNDENSFISNFKRKTSYRNNQAVWRHKMSAIDKAAQMLAFSISDFIDIGTTTFVPIPPSLTKSNADHDDRLLITLKKCSLLNGIDVQEILLTKEDIEPTAISGRRDISELEQNLYFDNSLPVREQIVLFDDVLATGSHFIACRNIIQKQYPDKKVIGIFIARSNHGNDTSVSLLP